MSATFLAELGRPEQALAEAEPLAERMEAAGDIALHRAALVQLRLLAERGAHEHAPAADELVATARESGEPQDSRWRSRPPHGCCSPKGTRSRRARCWSSSRRLPDIHADPYYAERLPELVRTALALAAAGARRRLVDGVEPRTPLVEHALCASRAQLAEAAGEHAEAAALYAEAAERWREFGNVPERAYALLGQGRCLRRSASPSAEAPLLEAASCSRRWASLRRRGSRRPPGVGRGCGSVATTAPTEPRHTANLSSERRPACASCALARRRTRLGV